MAKTITIVKKSLSLQKKTDKVLVEERSSVRIFTLNRPNKLNALTYEMLACLLELFTACADDSSVKLITLKGSGKAFCAGGDVATITCNVVQGSWQSGAKFFRDLFTLAYNVATCKKPQVSILNGIVMGGGAVLSMHSRFQVATEKSIFAMPEAALGLIVGASYFLSRLPGFFGEYLSLTGAHLDGAEMLACGLATHFVPSERLLLLEEALVKADSGDPVIISSVINEFSEVPKLKEKSAYNRLEIIDRCFSRRTVEEILTALELVAISKEDWIYSSIKSSIQSMHKASPTSLKLCLRSIREARLQGINKCLVREFRMACHVLRIEISNDLFEGCRATLLDRDKNPKWEPAIIELVTDEMVDRCFSRVEDDDWEDMKLKVRSNMPLWAIAKL